MDEQQNIMFQMHLLDREIKQEFVKLQMKYIDDRTVATHGWIIGYLYEQRENDIYQKDLERKFHMAPSSMTTILQSFEHAGYIERVAVSHDARLKKIALTEEGIRFQQNSMENFRRIEKQMIENVPEEQISVFQQVFSQMIENLKDVKEGDLCKW